ncbi:MAG: hypothetical protein JWQ87_2700 [Candidatus Sulfotelmatobacter sp.]|nr:hypothetical protein [Candidatus Sulfotelmatobacter sp.]
MTGLTQTARRMRGHSDCNLALCNCDFLRDVEALVRHYYESQRKKGVPVSTPFSPLSSLRLHQLALNSSGDH